MVQAAAAATSTAANNATRTNTAASAATSSNAANAGTSGNAAATTTFGDNFNTFLTLLTTQLRNQDPLSPLDTNQFTSQLVQFSSVEQQIRTNSALDNLVSLTRAGQSSAANVYLGRDALVSSPTTRADNGLARFDFTLASDTDQTNVRVRDSAGRIVFEGTGPTKAGEYPFSFNTADAINGGADPNGLYTLEVQGLKDGTAQSTSVSARVRVTGLDFAATDPSVFTPLGVVPISQITRILDPQSAAAN